MKEFRYGGRVAETASAAGIRGVLCRSAADDLYFFRVYGPNGEFTDYDLLHDDLEIIIAGDAQASFYYTGSDQVLDHSPEVLGLDEEAGEEFR